MYNLYTHMHFSRLVPAEDAFHVFYFSQAMNDMSKHNT